MNFQLDLYSLFHAAISSFKMVTEKFYSRERALKYNFAEY